MTTTTMTAHDLAERLGLPESTVGNWAIRWWGRVGHGVHRDLTRTDALVARAWAVIALGMHPAYPSRQRQDLAEAAIRARPRRWLLLTDAGASTHDTADHAAAAWADSGVVFGRLIDLEAET